MVGNFVKRRRQLQNYDDNKALNALINFSIASMLNWLPILNSIYI